MEDISIFKGFTNDYEDKLRSSWHNYFEKDVPMPKHSSDVRSIIFDSWRRSQEYKVSPLHVEDKILSDADLEKILMAKNDLISVAHSYILNLYSYVRGTNYIIALTDENGYVIDLVGDDLNIQARAKKSGLAIGCNRGEARAGTSGIGTCLATGQPIQIWGYEHYIKPHHSYLCSAAPIRNSKGELIGCLDLIGPVEAYHAHTLGMVCASVDGIEKAMKMEETHEKMFLANNQLKSTLQAISSGIIMMDRLGIITQHNNNAAKILKLPHPYTGFKNITDIIDLEESSLNPLDLETNINNAEATFVTCNHHKINVSVSASIIHNDRGEKAGTVLVIDELVRIHNLVNKISGFTAKYTFRSIIGNSAAISDVKSLGKLASQGTSNVLILGESGTGKELLAHSIHNASTRSAKPFIAINCGSLPSGLIESELFGYERGAFTGASQDGCPGKFELADGGTIFLDEIGDMPLELQASLLRVIQNKEIVRIGGKTSKHVDVRIMAATNADLPDAVEKKSFRSDLYYRLNVLSILIPPLREHPEDILILVEHFLKSCSNSSGRHIAGFTQDALDILCRYRWPGNIRQLENVIERSINLAQSEWISINNLPEEIVSADLFSSCTEANAAQRTPFPVISKEQRQISTALMLSHGNVSAVSLELGIPKRTLYRKIQKYKIDLPSYRVW